MGGTEENDKHEAEVEKEHKKEKKEKSEDAGKEEIIILVLIVQHQLLPQYNDYPEEMLLINAIVFELSQYISIHGVLSNTLPLHAVV